MYIERDITSELTTLAEEFPVVFLTGSRQSGKSTLLKALFPGHKYISFEDTDILLDATSDPRGFLRNHGNSLVLDEVQKVPELFNYLQQIVDDHDVPGSFILSGSQNFLLMEKVTQSLAGRVGILTLLPCSVYELSRANGISDLTLQNLMLSGGYPRIYKSGVRAKSFYSSYLQTYVERDVRSLLNIVNLNSFTRFIKLLAGRVGQVLNISSLANDADISPITVKKWLSILESSYILYLLKPYFTNTNKRLVKQPKVYFYDSGLLVHLLGIMDKEQLLSHYAYGSIFENFVITEFLKTFHNDGSVPELYFWRDNNNVEVDLIIDNKTSVDLVEIKSTQTMNSKHVSNITKVEKVLGDKVKNRYIVFADTENRSELYKSYTSIRDLYT
jgi:predicted AAA+ superfamily ATPase